MGHQRRIPAPGENLPGQHRPTVPTHPRGLGELRTDEGYVSTGDFLNYFLKIVFFNTWIGYCRAITIVPQSRELNKSDDLKTVALHVGRKELSLNGDFMAQNTGNVP